MVSQLMEVDDLTGRQTIDENRAPMLNLARPFCCNTSYDFLFALCDGAPTASRVISLVSIGYSLFQFDKKKPKPHLQNTTKTLTSCDYINPFLRGS
jgi:hypothetical protein